MSIFSMTVEIVFVNWTSVRCSALMQSHQVMIRRHRKGVREIWARLRNVKPAVSSNHFADPLLCWNVWEKVLNHAQLRCDTAAESWHIGAKFDRGLIMMLGVKIKYAHDLQAHFSLVCTRSLIFAIPALVWPGAAAAVQCLKIGIHQGHRLFLTKSRWVKVVSGNEFWFDTYQ